MAHGFTGLNLRSRDRVDLLSGAPGIVNLTAGDGVLAVGDLHAVAPEAAAKVLDPSGARGLAVLGIAEHADQIAARDRELASARKRAATEHASELLWPALAVTRSHCSYRYES